MTDLAAPPEVIITCEECQGEGSIEIWEVASKWAIDPPCGYPVLCHACHGAGMWLDDHPGDRR